MVALPKGPSRPTPNNVEEGAQSPQLYQLLRDFDYDRVPCCRGLLTLWKCSAWSFRQLVMISQCSADPESPVMAIIFEIKQTTRQELFLLGRLQQLVYRFRKTNKSCQAKLLGLDCGQVHIRHTANLILLKRTCIIDHHGPITLYQDQKQTSSPEGFATHPTKIETCPNSLS